LQHGDGFIPLRIEPMRGAECPVLSCAYMGYLLSPLPPGVATGGA
jgi:hypothetical protein